MKIPETGTLVHYGIWIFELNDLSCTKLKCWDFAIWIMLWTITIQSDRQLQLRFRIYGQKAIAGDAIDVKIELSYFMSWRTKLLSNLLFAFNAIQICNSQCWIPVNMKCIVRNQCSCCQNSPTVKVQFLNYLKLMHNCFVHVVK